MSYRDERDEGAFVKESGRGRKNMLGLREEG